MQWSELFIVSEDSALLIWMAPGEQTFRKDSNSLWSGIRGGLALAYFGTPLGWKLTPGLVAPRTPWLMTL